MIELSPTERAQYQLDCEFLRFLEQHAVITKCGYDFKSEEDKKVFHEKYQESLNSIRAVFGLSPIELSKSTLERVEKPPAKKRGRKPKLVGESPSQEADTTIVYDVSCEHNVEEAESVSFNPITPEQLRGIMNELSKANHIVTGKHN